MIAFSWGHLFSVQRFREQFSLQSLETIALWVPSVMTGPSVRLFLLGRPLVSSPISMPHGSVTLKFKFTSVWPPLSMSKTALVHYLPLRFPSLINLLPTFSFLSCLPSAILIILLIQYSKLFSAGGSIWNLCLLYYWKLKSKCNIFCISTL